mgnify:CR=1 FL=1
MMPSLPKLLGLIAIIWVVWTAFRIYETRQAAIRAQKNKQSKDGASANRDGAQSGSDESVSIELRECKICGTFYSGENCGQENCRR